MRLLVFCILFLTAQVGATDQLSDTSTLVVITHKGGLAKGLAHNHHIRAGSWKADVSGSDLSTLKLKLSFQVNDLQVDEFDRASKAFDELKAHGILSEPFAQVSDKDREKIRKAMLGKDQLDAAKFPTISGELLSVKDKESKVGTKTYPQAIEIALTIHGKRVVAVLAGKIQFNDAGFSLDAVGPLRFSQFGMEAYSAMMGMVSNQDEFHLLLHLASKAP